MKKISMLELRLNTEKIIKLVQSGQSLILTRRGNPVARIEPIKKETQDPIDPFFLLSGIGKVASLSNAEMDGIIYDK
jgi:prevent-host-death family protein